MCCSGAALLPPTIDFAIRDGVAEIPIEERDGEEAAGDTGQTRRRRWIETVRQVAPEGSLAQATTASTRRRRAG